MNRSDEPVNLSAEAMPRRLAEPLAEHPTSISHARFAALSSRLAQVAAKASADALAAPACAHDPMPADAVLRTLSDIRRMADAIHAISSGDGSDAGTDEP